MEGKRQKEKARKAERGALGAGPPQSRSRKPHSQTHTPTPSLLITSSFERREPILEESQTKYFGV